MSIDAGTLTFILHLQDRKLLWKLDLRLVPWLSLLYLVSFLDRYVPSKIIIHALIHPGPNKLTRSRTNIGNAKLVGLQDDLKLSGAQYNACLTIFFVSYSVFEPLTNILLKRLRPSIFIPIIMIAWVSLHTHKFISKPH